jgi:hypothetical protein
VPHTGSRTSFTGLGSRLAAVRRGPAEIATTPLTMRQTALAINNRTMISSNTRSMKNLQRASHSELS